MQTGVSVAGVARTCTTNGERSPSGAGECREDVRPYSRETCPSHRRQACNAQTVRLGAGSA